LINAEGALMENYGLRAFTRQLKSYLKIILFSFHGAMEKISRIYFNNGQKN
jgi:hypothetical protein